MRALIWQARGSFPLRSQRMCPASDCGKCWPRLELNFSRHSKYFKGHKRFLTDTSGTYETSKTSKLQIETRPTITAIAHPACPHHNSHLQGYVAHKKLPPRTTIGRSALSYCRVLWRCSFLWARYPCSPLSPAPLPEWLHRTWRSTGISREYRGTSLMGNRPTLAPYSRFMSRALWRS